MRITEEQAMQALAAAVERCDRQGAMVAALSAIVGAMLQKDPPSKALVDDWVALAVRLNPDREPAEIRAAVEAITTPVPRRQ